MIREEKIQKLNKLSKKYESDQLWKQVTKWDIDHEDALEDYVIIAFRLIKYMEKYKLKRIDLATTLGVTSQALGRILKGRQNLTLQTIRKMERVLGITLIKVIKEETQFSIISFFRSSVKLDIEVLDEAPQYVKMNAYPLAI